MRKTIKRKRNLLVKMRLLNKKLKDDGTPYGGISFEGETLKDFLDSMGIPYSTPLEKINKALKECGIKTI